MDKLEGMIDNIMGEGLGELWAASVRLIVLILFGIFGIIIFAISASTTFGFFYNFFNGLVPAELVGEKVAAVLAGIVGVILLDMATVLWLQAFLVKAKTLMQSVIAAIMTFVSFIGAAVASVAHLSLDATSGLFVMDDTTRMLIGLLSVATVIMAVTINFGAVSAFSFFSKASQGNLQEMLRSIKVYATENKRRRHLNDQVTELIDKQLTEMAPGVARAQAERLVAQWLDVETGRYNQGDAAHETPEAVLARTGIEDNTGQARQPDVQSIVDQILTGVQNGTTPQQRGVEAEQFSFAGANGSNGKNGTNGHRPK